MKTNDIDEQLKSALRRFEAPEGFADRILARVQAQLSPTQRSFWTLWRMPSMRWAAIAALVAVAVTGIGYQIHERQEEAEAMAAKQQVILALRITGSKLRIAKQKVKAMETGKLEN